MNGSSPSPISERTLYRLVVATAYVIGIVRAAVIATIASAAFAFCGIPIPVTLAWIIGGTFSTIKLAQGLKKLPQMIRDSRS